MFMTRYATVTAILTAIVFPMLSLSVAATPTANLAAGQTSYAKCMGCHSPEYNRTGPLHCGLLGRKSASVRSYTYSAAMRTANLVWNAETLDRFLAAPLKVVPGTSMGFVGIPDDEERRNLIAWLATLSASSDTCRNVLSTQTGSP